MIAPLTSIEYLFFCCDKKFIRTKCSGFNVLRDLFSFYWAMLVRETICQMFHLQMLTFVQHTCLFWKVCGLPIFTLMLEPEAASQAFVTRGGVNIATCATCKRFQSIQLRWNKCLGSVLFLNRRQRAPKDLIGI